MDKPKRLAKTRQQIASEYGINVKTLRKWLECEKNSLDKGLISPKHQKLIYKVFGKP